MTKPGRRGRIKRPPRQLPGGFFSVERRVLVEDMRGDSAMFIIWATLIGWANPWDSKEKVGGQQVVIKRGQLVAGLDELADEWDLSTSTVRRCLKYLKDTSRISMEISNHGTIITVINYDIYQRSKRDPTRDQAPNSTSNEQAIDKQSTSNRQAIDTIRTIEQLNQVTTEPSAIGSGTTAAAPPGNDPPKTPKPRVKLAVPESKSGPTWQAYRTAYVMTHGAEPVANAVTRSMCCRLVDMLGIGDAPEVAEYYVLNERNAWVFKNRHPLGELVKNSGKYHTDWKTGSKITASHARSVERTDGGHDAVARYLAKKHGATLGG